ncbi:MAG TPA: glycosyltransferase, partial [Usitatibacter sp.]|nr:glycosyltransferase [Usitatibacter sp.]
DAARSTHVVPRISDEASGPSYSVVRLCEALAERGHHVDLACIDSGPRAAEHSFVRAFQPGWGPSRLGRSPAMHRWLAQSARAGTLGVLHNHSLWMMPNVYPGWIAARNAVPLMLSPRGTLSAWAMKSGSLVKKVFWPVLQRPVLERATCFHATAESEVLDIREAGFTQPVALIPNGVDVPALLPPRKSPVPTVLFLGRVHPKKGLDLLIPAWRAVQERFPEWRLRIVGPDELGHVGEMNSLAARLGAERVSFEGPLYGEEKWKAYAEADAFVLPTRSENFAMTVAEALAAGTPAIVTRGAPWAGLGPRRAGWWVDASVEGLAGAMAEALSMSREERAGMGQRGREWMREEFSWDGIASMMAATYKWMRAGGEAPSWVRTGP